MSNTEQKTYRATFILDTRHNDESVDEIVTRITQTIGTFDGEVSKVHNLGIKDFERPTVRGFESAPYVQIDFSSDPDGPATLKEKLRLDKTVNRVVIISND